MTDMTGLQALFAAPGLYPLGADVPGRRLLFARLDPVEARRLAFHDARMIRPSSGDGITVDAGPLLEAAGSWASVRRVVFHTAFCGSTLLSRALDRLPGVHGWREPQILLQVVAGEGSARGDPDARTEPMTRQAWRDLALALLERGGSLGQVVIKAHDRVLSDAAEMLVRDPDLRAIGLHTDLDAFVIGCVKSEGRRTWTAETVASAPTAKGGPFAAFRPTGPAEQAAFLWLQRIDLLASARRRFGPGRFEMFDGGRLVAEREAMLPEIARGLDLPQPGRGLLADPLWKQHAKAQDVAMSPDAHSARQRRLAGRHADELAAARAALAAWLPDLPALSREIQRRDGLVVFAPAPYID